MSAFALIHGAGDVGRYWHLVALSRPAELADVLAAPVRDIAATPGVPGGLSRHDSKDG